MFHDILSLFSLESIRTFSFSRSMSSVSLSQSKSLSRTSTKPIVSIPSSEDHKKVSTPRPPSHLRPEPKSPTNVSRVTPKSGQNARKDHPDEDDDEDDFLECMTPSESTSDLTSLFPHHDPSVFHSQSDVRKSKQGTGLVLLSSAPLMDSKSHTECDSVEEMKGDLSPVPEVPSSLSSPTSTTVPTELDVPEGKMIKRTRMLTPEEIESIKLDTLTPTQAELIHRLAKEIPEATPSMLYRFCHARDFDYEKTKKFLEKHLAWRLKNLPIDPESIREEVLKEKFTLMGRDKKGQHIVWLFANKMGKSSYETLDHAMNAIVFGLERLAAKELGPTDKFAVIYSLRGAGSEHMDMDWAKAIAGLLQNNYPERLGAAYVTPVPFSLRVLWKVARGFFDPKTADKIFLLGHPSELLEHITPENLLPNFGGSIEYQFDIEYILGQGVHEGDTPAPVPPTYHSELIDIAEFEAEEQKKEAERVAEENRLKEAETKKKGWW